MIKKCLIILCIFQTTVCMHLTYRYPLSSSKYIQSLFNNRTGPIVYIRQELFVYLMVETSKHNQTNLMQQIQRDSFPLEKNEWVKSQSEPFYALLSYIPWDGNSETQPYHHVLLNDKEVGIFPFLLPQKIEFAGENIALTDRQHYQQTLAHYKRLTETWKE